jgi:hypothetical protein
MLLSHVTAMHECVGDRNYVLIAKYIFFSPEDGVGLVLKCGCLLTLTYYAFPRLYEFGERR